MKKLLFITALIICSFAQSQNVDSIFKQYITSNSTTEDLKEGLYQLEELCAVTPEEKCTKAKAMALYLIADDYYAVIYQLNQVDKDLSKPIQDKADRYYKKAEDLFPLKDFDKSQQRMLSEYKLLLEN